MLHVVLNFISWVPTNEAFSYLNNLFIGIFAGRVPEIIPDCVLRAAKDLQHERGGKSGPRHAEQPACPHAHGLPSTGRQTAVHGQDRGESTLRQPG